MKKGFITLIVALFAFVGATAQPSFGTYEHDIHYFIPKFFPNIKQGGQVNITAKYNAAVPQPKDVLGYELGEWYADWRTVTDYMYALERASERVKIQVVDYTHQNRPIIQVFISSPQNIRNLEAIRAEQLKLSDAAVSKSVDISKMPVIISHINSIHGNEQSAVGGSLAVAYFFAASEDATVAKILDQTVIQITPGMNPDGINRFATYANSYSSVGTRLADVNSMETSNHEPWPGSRGNHYWHDANRDLILCQHPEGRAYAKMACEWMPNVMYDNHEQWGGAGMYYSPGDMKRLHPLIPEAGQDMARSLGKYTAATLDAVNEKYFSERKYDDFYLGRGDVYGDIQGIINILLEQINSRGFNLPRKGTTLTYAQTTRNMAHVCIASVYAAWQLREELHNYQRDFFLTSAEQAKNDPIKGYVFNARGNRGVEYRFLRLMKDQGIDVYKLAKTTKADGVTYEAGAAYVIPMEQRYYLKFRGLWEDMTEYRVQNFYDVTTWSLKRAFNLQNAPVKSVEGLLGDKIGDPTFIAGTVVGGKSEIGYLIEAKELYSHNVISALLKNKVKVDVAHKSFKIGKQEYGCGTAIVRLQDQTVAADQIYKILTDAAKMNGVDVVALEKEMKPTDTEQVKLPKIALLTGRGMASQEAGQIWHILDKQFGLTPARIEYTRLNRLKNLSVYSTIIIPGGTFSEPINPKLYNRLKRFVELGGNLIVTGEGFKTARRIGVLDVRRHALNAKAPAAERNYGIIVNTSIDHESPLGWGYEKGDKIAIFKKGRTYVNLNESKFTSAPLNYTDSPYLSGYISQANLDMMAGGPAVIANNAGKGTVIFFVDNPNFRSYWYGATKLFMNAIYFGSCFNRAE